MTEWRRFNYAIGGPPPEAWTAHRKWSARVLRFAGVEIADEELLSEIDGEDQEMLPSGAQWSSEECSRLLKLTAPMPGQDEGEFGVGQWPVVVGESDAAVELGVAGEAFFDAGHADEDQAVGVAVVFVAQHFGEGVA